MDHLEIRNVSEVDILHEVEGLKTLSLHLANKCLDETNYMQVARAIRSQNSLETIKLDLSNNTNKLPRDIIREIFSSVNHSTHLKRLQLNIRVNNFDPLDVAIIASSIYKLENLLEIDILASFNPLNSECLTSLLKAISYRKELTMLRLDFQKANSKELGFKALAPMLANLKKLRSLSLNLSDNKIEDSLLVEISPSFKQFPDLKYLDF